MLALKKTQNFAFNVEIGIKFVVISEYARIGQFYYVYITI